LTAIGPVSLELETAKRVLGCDFDWPKSAEVVVKNCSNKLPVGTREHVR
jgi:hypothetical protein